MRREGSGQRAAGSGQRRDLEAGKTPSGFARALGLTEYKKLDKIAQSSISLRCRSRRHHSFVKGVLRVSSKLTSSDPESNRPLVVDGSSTGKLRPVARPISDGAMPICPRSGKQVPPLVLATISDEPLNCVEDAALTSFNGAAGSIARLMGRQATRAIFAEANLSVAANIIAAVIAGAAIVYILQCYLAQQ